MISPLVENQLRHLADLISDKGDFGSKSTKKNLSVAFGNSSYLAERLFLEVDNSVIRSESASPCQLAESFPSSDETLNPGHVDPLLGWLGLGCVPGFKEQLCEAALLIGAFLPQIRMPLPNL